MKHNLRRTLPALLMILCLLLSGCQKKKEGVPFEDLVLTMENSLEQGHFFFAGKVLSAGNHSTPISFYDLETETNTVYQVEVTEDYFGCMPEEPITVCIFGTKNNVVGRSLLEKDKTYIFDTTLWVHGEEIIYLLPSFYKGMPEISGESLYYTEYNKRDIVNENYAHYKEYLTKKAEDGSYGPELVLTSMKELLTNAAERDEAYFAQKNFEHLDSAHLVQTVSTAKTVLKELENTAASWAAIKEVLGR